MIPATSSQLLILVAVILPGIVFGTVLQRMRGPTPEDKDVGTWVLRATAVGVGLDLIYVIVGGTHLTTLLGSRSGTSGAVAHPRQTALWTLLLVGVIPTSLALLVHARVAYRDTPSDLSRWDRLKRARRTT